MKKILKSRKVLAVLLISFSILIEFIGAIIFWTQNKEQSNFIEILYYSSQIVGNVFLTSGVVVAVWQYYLSSKMSRKNFDIIQVQRAIDLSEYYKDNILKYFPAIRYIFEKIGVLELFNRISIDNMKDFDICELNKLLKPHEINHLKELQKSDNFTKAVLEANDIYGLELQFLSLATTSEEVETKVFDKNAFVTIFMANLMNVTLNNLEFFALHFHHNTADESVIYQSLHQTFLGNMPYLYYYIANNNTDPSNKLYTNVIWLFNKWKMKKKDQNAIRSKTDASVLFPGKVILSEEA